MPSSLLISTAVVLQGLVIQPPVLFAQRGFFQRLWCGLPLTKCDNDKPEEKRLSSVDAWKIKAEDLKEPKISQDYPLHKDILATYFEAGTPPGQGDAGITNRDSAWIQNWPAAYGGQDRYGKLSDRNPDNPYKPAGFEPRQNPFYVALPADFDLREATPYKTYWGEATVRHPLGAFYNQWVEVRTHDGYICYAQWKDVGPGAIEADFMQYDYVFGTAKPNNSYNGVGIDVSPACAIALGLSIEQGMMPVSWRFVDYPPPGPWLNTVTKD